MAPPVEEAASYHPMTSSNQSHENQHYSKGSKKEERGGLRHLVLTIDDDSLEGVGITAGEEVLIAVGAAGVPTTMPAGGLVCFMNRHGELMVGRYAPPYIELPYVDRTYRIPLGDRRVVGVVMQE